MPVFQNILQAIGNVPLVRLNKVASPDDAAVYAKCEFMNPGGSVKDRMAMYILDKAEREGLLKPGGTIVENTSGNTGMGVALWAAVRGYRCVFTMPDKMSTEKVNALKAFGADVVVTPTNVAAEDPRSYYETAKRIHRETPGGSTTSSRSPWRGGSRAKRGSSPAAPRAPRCTSRSTSRARSARARTSSSCCPTRARATSPSSIRTSG